MRNFNAPTDWGFYSLLGNYYIDQVRPWFRCWRDGYDWIFAFDAKPFKKVRGNDFYSCWCLITSDYEFIAEINRRRQPGTPMIWR